MTQHNTIKAQNTTSNSFANAQGQAPMANISEAMQIMSEAVASMSDIFRRIDRGGIAGYGRDED